nr:reverse transcriptase domain-containing protein [Tanacetum cinerariifolium]
MPNLKPSIPYPSRHDNERRRDQTNEQIEKFYKIFKEMSFKISITDSLMLMPKFASTLKALIGNTEKLSKMARTLMNEHYQTESKPVGIAKDVKVKVGVFHFLADFVVVDFEPDPRIPLILGSDFLLFEEADAFLGLEDDPDSPELDPSYYDLEGDILLLEAILYTKTIKSSIDEPPEVELKDLPPHIEYALLEGDNKLPIIIAKALRD